MEELTKLPDKWIIRWKNEESFKISKAYFNKSYGYVPDAGIDYEGNYWSDDLDDSQFKEISLEQFKKWVLKEEPNNLLEKAKKNYPIGTVIYSALKLDKNPIKTTVTEHILDKINGRTVIWAGKIGFIYDDGQWAEIISKPAEIDSFCVQVTEENREVVSKWRGITLLLNSYAGISYEFNVNGSKEHCNNSKWNDWFDKLLTTEQFYEKIGHKVEEKSLVGRWLKALVNFPQSTTYKKGEFAKIIDKHSSTTYKISSEWVYTIDNSTSTQWELMPEGFTPPQENNNVVCGVELIKDIVYHFKSKVTGEWLIMVKDVVDNKLFGTNMCLSSNTYYKNNNYGSIDTIESIRLATQEEKEHLLACEAAGKYVEPEKKYDYEVVHCITQQEWNFAANKLTLKRSTDNTEFSKNFVCIALTGEDCHKLIDCKADGDKIYSFQEWCDKFGHKPDFEAQQKPKFEVGRWYKIKGNWWAKFSCIHNSGKRWQYTEKIDWNGVHGYYIGSIDLISEIVLLKDLSEIQQYLPEDHPDKFKPTILPNSAIANKRVEHLSYPDVVHIETREEYNRVKSFVKQNYNSSYKYYLVGGSGGWAKERVSYEENPMYTIYEMNQLIFPPAVKEWSVGSYVVLIEDYVNTATIKKGEVHKISQYLERQTYTDITESVGKPCCPWKSSCKWFATKEEAEAFSKELLKSKKYIPQVGDWVNWTGSGQEAYQVWKVEDNRFWIWYNGEQKDYHNYSFDALNLRKVELGENIKFDDEHIKTSKKPSKEELLIEATRKYPKGTKFISVTGKSGKARTSTGKLTHSSSEKDICMYIEFEDGYTNATVYNNGRWAEIISVPEENKKYPLTPSQCYDGKKINNYIQDEAGFINKEPGINWVKLGQDSLKHLIIGPPEFTEKNTQLSNKKGTFAPIKANFINVKQLKTN